MPSLQSSQALAAGPTWDRTSTINAGKLSSSTVPSSLSSPVFPVLRDPVLSTGAPPFPDIQRAYPAGTQNFPDLWFLAGQGMEDAQVPSGSLRAPGNPVFSRGEQAVVSNRDHSSVDRLQESLQRPVPGATGLPSLPEKLPEQNTSPQRPETAGLSTERTPTAAPGAMTNLPGSDNALAPPAALPQLGSLFALLTGIDADKLWRFFTGGSAPPRPANDPGPQASSPVPSFLTGPLHLSTLLPSTPLVPETARSGAQLLPKPLDPTSSIAALTALRGIFPPLEVLKFGMHLEAPEEEQATRLAPEGGARSPEPLAAAA
ncbi:hypothetical protein CSUI_002096 [Cystoisospora suis]|uniref:Uncharacterized protein n=1 Tax=Cystoisospora suis TaxID=483139 RepID=A0A2C6LAA0_9APIC|nr:hypothetical protein CSUI_002096 [Cystoisospora suis]